MASALQTIPLKTITGEETTLESFAGKTLLIVNVASKCGLTPQYEALEELHQKYRDRGFSVLGFPANDFLEQEPGSDSEILTFCQATFNVDFPMFSKITVTGSDKHPLYASLIAAQPHRRTDPASGFRDKLIGVGVTPNEEPEVMWNFEKFLVGPDGTVLDRFAPDIPPTAPMVVSAIERAVG